MYASVAKKCCGRVEFVCLVAAICANPLFAAAPPKAVVLPEPERPSVLAGNSIAAGNDLLVVGAPPRNETSDPGGSAYVYRVVSAGWHLEEKLPSAGTRFGKTVASDGTVIAVATNMVGSNGAYGNVYVYRWNGMAWKSEANLSEPLSSQTMRFGESLAIAGNVIAIGDPGAATASGSGLVYIYRFDGTQWNSEAPIGAPAAAAQTEFGASLTLQANTLAVGCRYGEGNGQPARSGGAYLFEYTAGSWTPAQTLVPTDAAFGDGFGGAIVLDGLHLAVGASDKNGRRGQVYLYAKSAGVWSESARITILNPIQFTMFGESLSLQGHDLIVGALGLSSPPLLATGGVLTFSDASGSWLETSRVYSPGGPGTGFGAALARTGDSVFVGAPQGSQVGAPTSAIVWLFDPLVPDAAPPLTTFATISPARLLAGRPMSFLLLADDRTSGGSRIASGTLTTNGANPVSAVAFDGYLDEKAEALVATQAAPAPGIYNFCVVVKDSSGNSSLPSCIRRRVF